MNTKKIGIIGGMGPAATLDLYAWIIKLTPAKQDQDHLSILIENLPQIPDRTSFILGKGEDPRPKLLNSAKQLESYGAELLAIPCNTAHVFVDHLELELTTASIVNMIEETKKYVESKFQNKKLRIGILATTGTIKTNLYQNYFSDYEIITPSANLQKKLVMEAIYGLKGIKSGYTKNSRKLLREAAVNLHKKGADIVILACTEVSLVLKNEKNNGIVYINPVKILAQSLVRKSKEYVN